MKRGHKDDSTSLGSILLEWEIITEEQLELALREQETLRGDDLLGRLLVAGGACTDEEIRTAMSAQASMRAVGRHYHRALAVANVALDRQRRHSLVVRRANIEEQSKRMQKSITRERNSVITPAMLAEACKES